MQDQDDKNLILLKCIAELQKEIGKSIYQLSITEIMDYLSKNGQDISQRSVYLYLKNLGNSLFIQKISRYTKSYTVTRRAWRNGDYPDMYLLDEKGNEYAIENIPEYLAVEKGDKTLIYYVLTEKGKEFLKENDKNE